MRNGPLRPSIETGGRAGVRAWPPRLLAPGLGLVLLTLVLWPVVGLLWAVFAGSGWMPLNLTGALANSVLVAAVATLLALTAATPLAWLVAHTDVPYARVLRTITLVTLLVPSFAFALGWQAWGWQGVPPIAVLVLVLTAAAMGPIFVAATWALAHTDATDEEAGRMLGVPAGARTQLLVRRFRPALAAAGVLTFARALADLGAPLLTTAPASTPLLTTEILRVFEAAPKSATAAFAALLLCALTALLLRLAGEFGRQSAQLGPDDGGDAARTTVPLDRWRWPLLMCAAGVLALLVALPLLGLLTLAWPSISRVPLIVSLQVPLLATLTVATLAASLSLLIGASAAYLAHRRSPAAAPLLGRLCTLPAALPGPALAIGFAATYGALQIGSLLVLVLAVTVLALPSVLHHTDNGLARIPADEEHAARMLGAGPASVFRAIILPQLTPRLIGAWALVFAATCRELPTALMLAVPQLRPLAAESVASARTGAFEQAAALALATVLVSAAVIALAARASGEPLLMPRH